MLSFPQFYSILGIAGLILLIGPILILFTVRALTGKSSFQFRYNSVIGLGAITILLVVGAVWLTQLIFVRFPAYQHTGSFNPKRISQLAPKVAYVNDLLSSGHNHKNFEFSNINSKVDWGVEFMGIGKALIEEDTLYVLIEEVTFYGRTKTGIYSDMEWFIVDLGVEISNGWDTTLSSDPVLINKKFEDEIPYTVQNLVFEFDVADYSLKDKFLVFRGISPEGGYWPAHCHDIDFSGW